MLRNLGNFEKIIWHAGQVNSFNFVTIAHLKGEISPEILRQALDLAQPYYPMLNVRVTSENENDFFFGSFFAYCS